MGHFTPCKVVGADSKVVKRVTCTVCSIRISILDNWDTLKKHCGVAIHPDGTYSVDPNGTHAWNVARFEALAVQMEMRTSILTMLSKW